MTKFILFSITTLILWITTPNNPKPKESVLTSVTQEKNIVWTVTEGEANLVIQALQELPAKISNPLTQKLIQQAQQQMAKDTIPKKK